MFFRVREGYYGDICLLVVVLSMQSFTDTSFKHLTNALLDNYNYAVYYDVRARVIAYSGLD